VNLCFIVGNCAAVADRPNHKHFEEYPILATCRPAGFVFRAVATVPTASRAKTHQRGSWSHLGAPLDKGRQARQFVRMAFGPFAVKTSFGASSISSSTTAMAFVRALGPSYRTMYHWKVAERMLEVAWTSAEAESMAAQAFKIALEADDLLID
jgi:hypothetical protein